MRLDAKSMKALMRVALGEEPADLVIGGGDLVNVYSGEVLPNHSVAVKGKRIAYVGTDAKHTIGPETEVIDATGRVLIPGLVDGHAHMIFYGAPDEFISYAIKDGSTTIVTEMMELSYSFGYEGLVKWLECMKNQPIKIFSCVPPALTLGRIAKKRAPTLEQLTELLGNEGVVGLGESFWQEILRGETDFHVLSEETLRLKKVVQGHGAGCRKEKLAAYIAHGVSSCHESVTADEVVEKLRLGLWVMIREGSIRQELAETSKVKDLPIDFRRLVLVSDGLDPRDLIEKGHMGYVVQRAIDEGFEPVKAIQMATLNPAEHLGLTHSIGGIAPGKYADIAIIPELRTIKAEYLISEGAIVLREGDLVVRPNKINLPQSELTSWSVDPSDFAVREEGQAPVRMPAIDQVSELVTKKAVLEMIPRDGRLSADPDRDVLKVSLLNCEGKIFSGFIRGLGMKAGALATSTCWENFGVIAIGDNDEEMASAMTRVFEMGGGIVLYANGKRSAELPLPIGGQISNLPLEEVAQRLRMIQKGAEALGFRFKDAPLTVATLTTPAIPFIRISEDGLLDFRSGKILVKE